MDVLSYSDKYVLDRIVQSISPEYLQNSDISIKSNKSSYNSIVVSSGITAYRPAVSNLLFARIKTTGKSSYISFPQKYDYLFDSINVHGRYTKSDTFIRYELSTVFEKSNATLSPVFCKIFVDVFSFEPFGCCEKYVECSDEKRCLHKDPTYATACMYRKNLEAGRIFYGKNANA